MVDSLQIDDCWKRIGVWSPGARCERLAEVVHCRNCPTYSATGRKLLEREFTADMREQATQRYAAPAAVISREKGTSFTVFRVGTEWLAIPTRTIERVGDPVPVRRIPHRSSPVLCGLGNFFGEIELVISIEALLGLEPLAKTGEQERGRYQGRATPRMLLLNREAGRLAFVTAEVLGTWRQHEGELGPVPSTLARALLRYVRATMMVDAGIGRADASAPASAQGQALTVGILDMGLLAYSVEQLLK